MRKMGVHRKMIEVIMRCITIVTYSIFINGQTRAHKTKRKKHKKLFRFESMWLSDARCKKIVSEAWSEGLSSVSPFPIVRCLEVCKLKLENWNHTEFGHVKITQQAIGVVGVTILFYGC